MTLATVDRYRPDRVEGLGDHAVVVGGSVAGLTTARVLADAFERVTVVEKDPLPAESTPRSGVPQGGQIHVLQEAGRATITDLLPEFPERVIRRGGVLVDGATDIAFHDEGAYLADGPTRMPTYSASRPLFENVTRTLVAGVDGVTLRSGCRMTGYLTRDGGARVAGVELREGGNGTERLSADLVVDATGRTSRTPAWLRDHGFDAPPVDEVEIDIGYSTVAVDRPPSDRRTILALASPPRTRGGAVFPVEGDRWLVNLHGVHGDHPPTDLDGFAAFAESLRVPEIRELFDGHRTRSEAASYYPFKSSLRRYYGALDRFPEGLVVVGDAIASFNPIYGQGMSVAALEALALHHTLAKGGLSALGPRFFARAEPIVDASWRLAVGADFGFPETTGPKPSGSDLFRRYFSRLTRRAHDDGWLREALFQVFAMEVPPTALLRPRVLWRALRPRLSERGGQTEPVWKTSGTSSMTR